MLGFGGLPPRAAGIRRVGYREQNREACQLFIPSSMPPLNCTPLVDNYSSPYAPTIHGRRHKFSTVYAYFISLPSPSSPVHTLTPHPSIHSLLLSSRPRWMVAIPRTPSFPFPPLHFPLPGVPPPKPARGLGERYKLPQWGLGRSPSWQTIWWISGPKGAALQVATVFFCAFHKNKCNFLRLWGWRQR